MELAADPDGSDRVLVVDDDALLREVLVAILGEAGLEVDTASSGAEAVAKLDVAAADVILSDVAMPGMDGIELLKRVRERDLDVPVVLMTGGPTLASAVKAVEYGAFRYLSKPMEGGEVVSVVQRAARMHRLARLKRMALDELGSGAVRLADRALLEAQFTRVLESLFMAHQPIVSMQGRALYAYEALMRSTEPALPHPGAVLQAAERLGRLHDLGRAIRRAAAATLGTAPPEALLFVNLHPADLRDDDLYDRRAPLGRAAPRVVLEVTERASLEGLDSLSARVRELREIGFRIAIDDLGAGYAGLSSLARLEPEVVKLDMSLVRGLHEHPTRLRLVESMASVCRQLGMVVVSEGVEGVEERDALLSLGCDLAQGFFFARPSAGYPEPRFA
jgi:EAL domain-containing protein (putative c-di-GMP-specific phosphodiesterase class I)/CheY-like chemotaxis protein